MPSFQILDTYEPVFSTDCRIIDLWGGRGRGGSHFVTDYFLFLITQPKYFRGYFVRNVFADIRDSLFRDFKDRIFDNPTLNINDFNIQENEMRIIYKPTGNSITSKGTQKDGVRTAKMKSLAGATHVAIEEADEISKEDFDQLDLSLRTTKVEQVQILRVFNPPGKNHWIWRDYVLLDSDIDGYYTAHVKAGANLLSIFSTYEDNIENIQASTITKFEGFKSSDPDYYYNIVRGLIPEGAKGRIYKGWKSITAAEFEDLDVRTIYALDFGYSGDPNAMIANKIKDRRLYARELLYETGLDNLELAKRLIDLGVTKEDLIIADYGNGGDVRIAELRRGFIVEEYPALRHGFNIHPAVKGKVVVGINNLKSYQVFVTEESSNIWFEYQEYKWALDRDKNPTNEPVDKDNHAMDTMRYACSAKGRLF